MGPSILVLQRHALWFATHFASWAGLSRQVYFEQRVGEYRKLWERVAMARGGTLRLLGPDLWEIAVADGRVRIRNHELPFDDPVALAVAGRKPAVHALLAQAGIQVPDHLVFRLDRLEAASRFASGHPEGCVVKPAGGYGGKGVTTHVRGPGEVRRAAIRAAVHDRELLIEQMVPGESYRLLVMEGRVVDAVVRRGPRVTGDGVSSIRTLIGRQPAPQARRGERLTGDDRDLQFTLAYQGLTPDSVPADGQVVVVKSIDAGRGRTANVRTVYTDSALDHICPAVRRDAEAAAAIVQSDFLGVDVITRDPSVSLAASGGVINEVNTTPALHHHYDPDREPFPRVAPLILEAMLRRQRRFLATDAVAPPRPAQPTPV